MKTLQQPVSETQKNAMFYDGLIATSDKGYNLETHQSGEVGYNEHLFTGSATPKLATHDVHDSDLEAEVIVEIYVDKFFAITFDGGLVDEGKLIFDDYDEAVQAFQTFIN